MAFRDSCLQYACVIVDFDALVEEPGDIHANLLVVHYQLVKGLALVAHATLRLEHGAKLLHDHLKARAFQRSDLLLQLIVLLPKLKDVLSLHRFSKKQPFTVAVDIRDLIVSHMHEVLVWRHIFV